MIYITGGTHIPHDIHKLSTKQFLEHLDRIIDPQHGAIYHKIVPVDFPIHHNGNHLECSKIMLPLHAAKKRKYQPTR